MAEIEEVKSRGGARHGAGRPLGTTKPETKMDNLNIRISSEQHEELKRRAAAAGLTKTKYVILKCLD